MAQTVLELRNIRKAFPGVLALDNIDFDLQSGEIHAICGENGAGKSTLMKVVCGVYTSDQGEIKVMGEQQTFSNPLDAYQKGVSIIFQEGSLFEEMTVLDNLFLGHEPVKKDGPFTILDYAAMRKKAAQIFARLDTKINLDEYIKNLGMAQKQIVEIAKALTFDAKIIIFDEPTASLTEREVNALFNIIRSLKEEELGIVYISHRMEEIFRMCDRVTVIRDGRYISTRGVADTNQDEIVADMVGRKMDSYYPKTDTKIGQTIFRVEHLYDNGFLSDISFHVDKGEILGFAGLAGAGRTELMEALCGFTKKIHGKVWLHGEEIEINDYKDALKRGIVYVSEDRGKYGLVLDMSVEQNISMPQLKKIANGVGILDIKQEQKLGERFMQEMEIKAPDGSFITANLSGGNQQKVSISKALALNPQILILDEPTRGVDVGSKAEIHKIISELTSSGLTIIMISSELPELIGMCDRIYIMREGSIGGCFDRDEVTQEKILTIALESNNGTAVDEEKTDGK